MDDNAWLDSIGNKTPAGDVSWVETARPPRPRRKRTASPMAMGVAVAVFGFVGCVVLILVIGAASSGPSKPSCDYEETAKQEVLAHLYCPSTASFGECYTENLSGGRYRISGTVDAQNRFGAMLRKHWTVEIEVHSGGRYRLINIEMP